MSHVHWFRQWGFRPPQWPGKNNFWVKIEDYFEAQKALKLIYEHL